MDTENLSGIPADFTDNVDNDTSYSAGWGLDLTVTTFSVEVPLALSGSVASGGILSGTNSNAYGFGVYVYATGTDDHGVYGIATNNGDATNYGRHFSA